MGCFRVAILEVLGLELVVAISALMQGFRVGGFYYSLYKRFPRDLLKLLSYSKRYINVEEVIAAKNKEKGERKHPQENHFLPPSQSKRWSDKAKSCHHSKSPHPCHEEFMPLNAPQKHILIEINNKDIVH